MDKRSPVQQALLLHKVDADRGVARSYSSMFERDLFGTSRLVRNRGEIGTNGQQLARCSRPKTRPGRRRLRGRSDGGAIGTCDGG
jgi:hypothetical protein